MTRKARFFVEPNRLGQAGTTVGFQSYAGGHGWLGNPFNDIHMGLTWLEQQAAKDLST